MNPSRPPQKNEYQSAPSLEAQKVQQAVLLIAHLPLNEDVLDLTLRKMAQNLLLLKEAPGNLADPQKGIRQKSLTGKQPLKCSIKATWFGSALNARPGSKVSMDLLLVASGTTGEPATLTNLQILS